jgi:enoyl-CoA hydratase/carnithine racemase
MELVLLNRTLSAKEALDWGIANRVVADEEPRGGNALHRSSTRGGAYQSLRSGEAADALRIYRKPRNSD